MLAGSCAEARSSEAPLAACQAASGSSNLSLVCARRTWEKTLIINRLLSNHQSLQASLPPLALQEASGALGRSEKQWRNARKRMAAKAGQPGVKGYNRCLCNGGSLRLKCGRRRSSACSLVVVPLLLPRPLQPQRRQLTLMHVGRACKFRVKSRKSGQSLSCSRRASPGCGCRVRCGLALLPRVLHDNVAIPCLLAVTILSLRREKWMPPLCGPTPAKVPAAPHVS